MKVGDTFQLSCGHDGRVVHVNDDGSACARVIAIE